MNTTESPLNNRQRVIDHGEVFTPPGLVADMLDLVAHECERVDSRFLEPACGNGNFLAEILRRKLKTVDALHAANRVKWERDAFVAATSVYGIDLLPDNVAACRDRLLEVVNAAHRERFGEALSDKFRRALAFVLARNVQQGDALSFRTADGGSIIFSEWAPAGGNKVKRRDFAYGHLIEHSHTASLPLFSDLGRDVFLPRPVGERPLCHFLEVADTDEVGVSPA